MGVNRTGELSGALVQVDIGLLADEVGVTATDTLDLGEGVDNLLLAVDVGVEQTQDELEVRLRDRSTVSISNETRTIDQARRSESNLPSRPTRETCWATWLMVLRQNVVVLDRLQKVKVFGENFWWAFWIQLADESARKNW